MGPFNKSIFVLLIGMVAVFIQGTLIHSFFPGVIIPDLVMVIVVYLSFYDAGVLASNIACKFVSVTGFTKWPSIPERLLFSSAPCKKQVLLPPHFCFVSIPFQQLFSPGIIGTKVLHENISSRPHLVS